MENVLVSQICLQVYGQGEDYEYICDVYSSQVTIYISDLVSSLEETLGDAGGGPAAPVEAGAGIN